MRPATISAALFDFDGVMVDSEPLSSALDLEAFKTYGIEPTWDELFTFVGTDGYGPCQALFKKYGIDATLDDLRDPSRHAPRGSIYLMDELHLMEGATQLLQDLRASGIKTGLVTTTEAAQILGALNRLGITSAFDVIISGDMVSEHKPSPLPYARAMEVLGVDPAETVIFEDSPTGIQSALAAGAYVVGFKGSVVTQDTSSAHEELASFCDFKI